MIQKTGDWEAFERLQKQLNTEIKKAVKQAQMQVGLKVVSIVKHHLQAQDLAWVPLNKEYLERKVKKGYSEKTLIKTSTMFQAINSTTKSIGGKQVVFAGILRAKVDPKGNIIANIAALHEYGSKSRVVPERPLWRPSLGQTVQWMLTEKPFNKSIINALDKLKKK